MIQLLREFWRIIKQMRGKENMFGYQTTTANQLYLLCCFCGKFYFSDKIHPQMKYFWFLINFSGLMTAFAILLGYFLYDTRQDYVLQLTVINAVSTCVNLVVTFPIVLYCYQSGVEKMISGVDEILVRKSRTRLQKRNIRSISVKWVLVFNCLVIFAMSVIYGFAPFLDVMIFYEDEKLKNPVYYILPLPNVHEYGSMEWFLASGGVISMYYSLFSLEWLAMTNFIIFWGITCHNEMLLLHDRLNSQMRRLYVFMDRGYEMPANWNEQFNNILKKHVDDYKSITRVIEDFRGFVEKFCTTAILVNFFIQVVQPYVILSTDMLFCVRLKGIAYQVIAGWPMFLMYWTGQIIENGIAAVSFSVYSVPWYWSLKARQDTYIFLCRTQRMESIVMLRVYPLVLRNYSRLAHAILSSVNILRTLALKAKNS